jgi:hypothetical protein
VVGIKGAVLEAQDGVEVTFRKKCAACGYEAACPNTATIRSGTTRLFYFYPTCREMRGVEISTAS